jgi:hypothetical protein
MKLLGKIVIVLALCVLLGGATSASAWWVAPYAAPCHSMAAIYPYATTVVAGGYYNYWPSVTTVVPVTSAVYYAPTVVTATYPVYYSAPVVVPRVYGAPYAIIR